MHPDQGMIGSRRECPSLPAIHGHTKEWYMSLRDFAMLGAFALLFSGCASIAGSSSKMLTDDRIKAETSGALGYQPEDLALTSRRTEGLNTYASLKARDGKEFTCIINGGNWLSMGMTNPPMCSPKGQAIKVVPFQ
jgi:hypothetical protein